MLVRMKHLWGDGRERLKRKAKFKEIISTTKFKTIDYRKLVETFHIVNECKTAVYFKRWSIHVLAKQNSGFDH